MGFVSESAWPVWLSVEASGSAWLDSEEMWKVPDLISVRHLDIISLRAESIKMSYRSSFQFSSATTHQNMCSTCFTLLLDLEYLPLQQLGRSPSWICAQNCVHFISSPPRPWRLGKLTDPMIWYSHWTISKSDRTSIGYSLTITNNAALTNFKGLDSLPTYQMYATWLRLLLDLEHLLLQQHGSSHAWNLKYNCYYCISSPYRRFRMNRLTDPVIWYLHWM